ncbi:MAG TPA: hypothetical protein VHB21_00340 [Minicystis sp.]|nr:hypothetical protein [Minicystis sp.]
MERSSFDTLAELLAADVDRSLVRRALQKTPDERLAWLEEMQALMQEMRRARQDEASRAAPNPR